MNGQPQNKENAYSLPSRDMSKNIIYYIEDAPKTHLFRFYENGTTLYIILTGNVLGRMESILSFFNEEEPAVYIGRFQSDGKKISFDIETGDGEFDIYKGNILSNGDLNLNVFKMNSPTGAPLVLKAYDNAMQFDWKNSTNNNLKSVLLDLRRSTFEQLQHKLGEANVFCIDSEGIIYPEIFFPMLNNFLLSASKELPDAQVKTGDNPSIVLGNNSYALDVDDRIRYISNMQILKDFNAILEAQNSQKRFFYFDDNGDNDMNCSYFYCDKDFGLQLIEFLNNPPFYSLTDFENRSENRNINMHFVDSSTEMKATYFKRMFPDF
jgi:hypothetical protein